MERAPGFELRAVRVEAGIDRIYNPAEWADALVVVTSGELELESLGGDSFRFGHGSILCLERLPVRVLRSGKDEPALLVAVSRR